MQALREKYMALVEPDLRVVVQETEPETAATEAEVQPPKAGLDSIIEEPAQMTACEVRPCLALLQVVSVHAVKQRWWPRMSLGMSPRHWH